MLQLDNEFFKSFSDATVKTLGTLCQTPTTPKQPFTKGTQAQAPWDIAGFIGITSSMMKGSIALCFPKAVFIDLLEKMIGEKVSEISKDNEDAAAELLNIIFGDAKVVLNAKGHAIQMAIPSVLRGESSQSSYTKGHVVKVHPFETAVGEFYVEFLLRESEPSVLDTTTAPAGPVKAHEEAAFFRPFVEGMLKTLNVQCKTDAKAGKPFKKQTSNDYVFDVAGVVGITSKTVNGSFMLSFRLPVFLKLVSQMIGQEYAQFEPGLEDGVAELVNIILGSAKNVLNQQGHGLQGAIPTVVHGKTMMANASAGRNTIVVPFTCDYGEFHVEITIQ